MKADSGNWLYIILSIVFVVLSMFGNKDKKKPTSSTPPLNDEYEPSPSSERKWPKSLEDVLTEVLDLPKQQQTTVKTASYPQDVLENPRNSYEKIEDEAQSLETIDDEVFTYESSSDLQKNKMQTNNVQTVVTPSKVEQPQHESEPVVAFSNFDLREGIIYAEILNRKYF